VPAVSGSPEPSVSQGSPDVAPAPSANGSSAPSDEPSDEPTTPDASPSPSSKPSGTTIVRAYFWLGGGQGSAGLVATLREGPGDEGRRDRRRQRAAGRPDRPRDAERRSRPPSPTGRSSSGWRSRTASRRSTCRASSPPVATRTPPRPVPARSSTP
jgi:hypothetical protein